MAVYQSKFGFHPVSKDECHTLKEAHKLLLRAYKDVRRFIRWDARSPQNQVGPQPTYPANYIENGYHKSGEKIWSGLGFRKCKSNNQLNLYQAVLAAYSQARRPAPTQEEVKAVFIPAGLADFMEELQKYYAEMEMVAA